MKKLFISLILVLSFVIIGNTREPITKNIVVLEETQQGTSYIVYIDGKITYPTYYIDLSVFLRKLKAEDTVYFNIVSPGGFAITAMMIYNDILTCKAKTIAQVHYAHSGGAIIALACEEMIIYPTSSFMIHEFQLGKMTISGAYSDLVEYFKARKKENDVMTKILYQSILNEDQMKRVLNGEDLLLQGEELEKAVKNWKPVNKKKRDKIIKVNLDKLMEQMDSILK